MNRARSDTVKWLSQMPVTGVLLSTMEASMDRNVPGVSARPKGEQHSTFHQRQVSPGVPETNSPAAVLEADMSGLVLIRNQPLRSVLIQA